MKKLIFISAIFSSFALGCGDAEPETESVTPQGKADGASCDIGYYEFEGRCQDPLEICTATGGLFADAGCACPDDGNFYLSLGCTTPSEGQALCETGVGQGTWSEIEGWSGEPGAQKFDCECPAETALDANDGMCKDWITLCQDTGGSAHDWGCNCGPDQTFYMSTGGCTDNYVAEAICENSGGGWEEVPGYDVTTPGSSHECQCPDIRFVSDWTGRCELPSASECEATGGTEYDWGCFCGTDSYFITGEGGCVESNTAQNLCENSGGAWTETPNFEEASMNGPTERHYCLCQNSYYEATTGTCETF
ncbi:hypothetical protein FRD01_22110 [Microvenator marinus]|uniref:Uncharacterized protein n=1 Tax=Microvenator marinus TaxID=2600177 RepID=A0A5B8XY36_9DELT|nr:hypothetical protein [Microvenator marinus]QED29878.1 hypothetical protein FRD01_22110 [Microvenator marinus]